MEGMANMRDHVSKALAALPADTDPMGRIGAAVEAHLRYELEVSDFATASIRNAGQLPDHIHIRYSAEASKYGDVWRQLVQDAADAGLLRSDLDLQVARMMILGALNCAAEWRNPHRGSLETVARTARSMVRHGLGSPPVTDEEAPEPQDASQEGRS